MIHTLHDFMHATKGQEYLIGVVFLIVFTVFWAFLDKRKKGRAVRK